MKGAHGGAVGWGTALQAGRLQAHSQWYHWNFSLTHSFWLHYGPGVELASTRNENQEYFLGVKTASVQGWQPYHLHAPTVLKSGSLNLLAPSGPVQACIGITWPLHYLRKTWVFFFNRKRQNYEINGILCETQNRQYVACLRNAVNFVS